MSVLAQGYSISPLASLMALRRYGTVLVAVPPSEPARELLEDAAHWHARARAAARATIAAYPDKERAKAAVKLQDEADARYERAVREATRVHRRVA
ncbi:MAG: hypothetical protein M3R38_12305 [Actinomycetota bacterium]|nr:hypothetical protein [Actinomycetota bacterium]MDP9487328.1 hypothetical protein [Actinomycetota bacterium]